MAYLGEWVVNANRVEDREEAFRALASYVYSFAESFGYANLIDSSSGGGKCYASRHLEEVCEGYIQDYDNEIFWDELADRLAERDLLAQFGRNVIKKMSPEELFEKRTALAERYEEEFQKYGLKRLIIGG